MDEPSGGTLRFSGHWILTNVFVTQANILTSVSSIPTYVKTSPENGTLPYLFNSSSLLSFCYKKIICFITSIPFFFLFFL